MRVLHVIDSLAGSGGAEHGLVREIVGFDRRTQHLVVTLFSRDELSDSLREAGIATISLGFDSRTAGWSWPLAAWRLRGVMREFEPDVLHSSLFMSNLVAQLAARSRGIPVLSTFTLSGDRGLLRAHQPGASSARAEVLRRIAGLAARSRLVFFRALTVDTCITSCSLLGVSLDRATVIPRGVPLTESDVVRTRSDLGLPEDALIVLNVGRQTAQKGQIHLIRAFARLSEGLEAHLVVVGRESDATEALRAAILDHELAARVTIVGYTTAVPDYLAHASVFAFPSLMEGLGTAVLEAMAARVPVVAFDIPPIREITDGGRLAQLVPVQDEEALLDALTSSLADFDHARVAQALDHVRANHSLPAVSARLERLLEVVARNG